jgi:hypothetical protein
MMSFTLLTITVSAHDWLAAISIGRDVAGQFDPLSHGLLLAQQFQTTDVMGNIQNGWKDFLQTGKAGALAVGLVMGYTIRGITR